MTSDCSVLLSGYEHLSKPASVADFCVFLSVFQVFIGFKFKMKMRCTFVDPPIGDIKLDTATQCRKQRANNKKICSDKIEDDRNAIYTRLICVLLATKMQMRGLDIDIVLSTQLGFQKQPSRLHGEEYD